MIEPHRRFTQRELARLNGLDEGFTSRIVRRLKEQGLISRGATGAVEVADFQTMLEGWHQACDFSRHHIQRGHIAARSSEELLRKVAEGMKGSHAGYAATGLAGAWLLNKFAAFRLAVFYFEDFPSSEVKRRLGFYEMEQGGNVWFVTPDDEGVFHGAGEHEGTRCCSTSALSAVPSPVTVTPSVNWSATCSNSSLRKNYPKYLPLKS